MRGVKPCNLIGLRFGDLTAVKELPPTIRPNGRQRRYLRCICKCGGTKDSSWDNLKSGAINNCGCKSSRHGGFGTKLHGVWHGMVQRCTDKNYKWYKNYGARGITICKEWRNSFKVFRTWAMENGYKEGLTIERINNDGGYYPYNCTWIPPAKQAQNRRDSVIIRYSGHDWVATSLAKKLGVNYSTLLYRHKRGQNLLGGKNAVC